MWLADLLQTIISIKKIFGPNCLWWGAKCCNETAAAESMKHFHRVHYKHCSSTLSSVFFHIKCPSMNDLPILFIKNKHPLGQLSGLAVKWQIWGQGESSFKDCSALQVVAKPWRWMVRWPWRWWGRKRGKRGGVVSADAHRQTALPETHESCWSLRQLSPSPPPTLPPLPLPSVRHTRMHTHI